MPTTKNNRHGRARSIRTMFSSMRYAGRTRNLQPDNSIRLSLHIPRRRKRHQVHCSRTLHGLHHQVIINVRARRLALPLQRYPKPSHQYQRCQPVYLFHNQRAQRQPCRSVPRNFNRFLLQHRTFNGRPLNTHVSHRLAMVVRQVQYSTGCRSIN